MEIIIFPFSLLIDLDLLCRMLGLILSLSNMKQCVFGSVVKIARIDCPSNKILAKIQLFDYFTSKNLGLTPID
jgi:hypothetical protein